MEVEKHKRERKKKQNEKCVWGGDVCRMVAMVFLVFAPEPCFPKHISEHCPHIKNTFIRATDTKVRSYSTWVEHRKKKKMHWGR